MFKKHRVTRTSWIYCGRNTVLWSNVIKVSDLISSNQGFVKVCTAILLNTNWWTVRNRKDHTLFQRRIILARKSPNVAPTAHTALMSAVCQDTDRNTSAPQRVSKDVCKHAGLSKRPPSIRHPEDSTTLG